MATYKGAKWFTERYGTSASTLRSWAHQGWVDHIRTRGGIEKKVKKKQANQGKKNK